MLCENSSLIQPPKDALLVNTISISVCLLFYATIERGWVCLCILLRVMVRPGMCASLRNQPPQTKLEAARANQFGGRAHRAGQGAACK